MTKRQKALAQFLIEEESATKREAVETALTGCDEELQGFGDFKVLTNEEADEHAKEYILETVWAFNKSFLDCHSEAIAEMDEEVWEAIQSKCESSNATILRLIDDIEHFVEDAVLCDGRGHFLSSYDGNEYEQQVDGEYFYIYKN